MLANSHTQLTLLKRDCNNPQKTDKNDFARPQANVQLACNVRIKSNPSKKTRVICIHTLDTKRWYEALIRSSDIQLWCKALIRSLGAQPWFKALIYSLGTKLSSAALIYTIFILYESQKLPFDKKILSVVWNSRASCLHYERHEHCTGKSL